MVDKELAIKVPENLMVRAPILDDAPAITDLMNACHQKYSGEIGSTVDEVLEDWKLPGFDLARDAWLMLTSDNRIVGYESSWHRDNTGRIYLDGYVHPEFNGQGIGTYLLHQAEARAADFTAHYPAEVRICVRASCWSNEAAAVQLFNDEGYHLIRHFWTMAIEMDEPPTPPEWPTGLSVRTFVRGQDEHAVHEAVTEAFRDHWGSVPVPFEEWVATRIETAGFDPSLKFLAVEHTRGEVAGVALLRYRPGSLDRGVLVIRFLNVYHRWERRIDPCHHVFVRADLIIRLVGRELIPQHAIGQPAANPRRLIKRGCRFLIVS